MSKQTMSTKGTQTRQTGSIHVPPGTGAAFDLTKTVESGQTFSWRREHGQGKMFDGGTAERYVTVIPRTESPTGQPEPLRVAQPDQATLTWEARFDAEETVKCRFRLGDDLHAIRDSLPSDDPLDYLFQEQEGLRVPNDPPFPTLIAFICSQRNQLPYIHRAFKKISRRFGEAVEFEGTTYHSFPSQSQLSVASQDQLFDCKTGYRDEYLKDTLDAISSNKEYPGDIANKSYNEAYEELTSQSYKGVGQKVANCILLMGFGHLSAFPVDGNIKNALNRFYPSLIQDSTDETMKHSRDYFGDYAGYAQAYLYANEGSS
jgi:N-glycosylase/DNA lyase